MQLLLLTAELNNRSVLVTSRDRVGVQNVLDYWYVSVPGGNR